MANYTAGAGSRETARETVITFLLGIVALLAALAILEGRARMRFLSLHTHLEDPQVISELRLGTPITNECQQHWQRQKGATSKLCSCSSWPDSSWPDIDAGASAAVVVAHGRIAPLD